MKPQQFVDFANMAEEIGFAGVMAGPMVRSSYRAGRLWARAMRKNGYPIPENLAHIEGEGAALQEASSWWLQATKPFQNLSESVEAPRTRWFVRCSGSLPLCPALMWVG